MIQQGESYHFSFHRSHSPRTFDKVSVKLPKLNPVDVMPRISKIIIWHDLRLTFYVCMQCAMSHMNMVNIVNIYEYSAPRSVLLMISNGTNSQGLPLLYSQNFGTARMLA